MIDRSTEPMSEWSLGENPNANSVDLGGHTLFESDIRHYAMKRIYVGETHQCHQKSTFLHSFIWYPWMYLPRLYVGLRVIP
jgi:hypothetical protein